MHSTKGSFTGTVSVPMSVTAKVYHCADDDGPFDGQIEFGTHSVRQRKFDGDEDDDGDGRRKRTFRKCISIDTFIFKYSPYPLPLHTSPQKNSHK